MTGFNTTSPISCKVSLLDYSMEFLQKLPGVSASATYGDLADIREYFNDVNPDSLCAAKVRSTPRDTRLVVS
jgi:hypothetical protein